MTIQQWNKVGPTSNVDPNTGMVSGPPIGTQGIQEMGKYFEKIGSLYVPDGYLYPKGKPGWQLEDPQSYYPNALLPCVDVRFALKWTLDAVTGVLTLSAATVNAINLLSVGVGDPGAGLGLWWTLTDADSTLQQNGAFVFQGHTFWAWGHTFAFEGLSYRGGDPATPLAADPIMKSSNLQYGQGSYAEQIIEASGTNIGLRMEAQGDNCPRWLGNLVYNGDKAQLAGGGLVSLNDAQLPFKPWERPLMIGSRDNFYKMFARLHMSQDIQILPVGGNPPIRDVYAFWRMRVCGSRECGEYVPGCAPR